MPIGDSSPVVQVLVRIAVESKSRGLAQTSETFDRLEQGAKRAKAGVRDVDTAINESGRTLFRYTFYAMWFAQVVQAYLGYRVIRAFLAPAEAADEALVRLKAISGATVNEMRAVTDFADAMSVATPFAFDQVVRGVEAAVRAGLNLAQAMDVVKTATGLAVAEGISLAEATEFLSQVMFSFQLKAEGVGKALDMIFEAARQSPYTFGQVRSALSLTMASASALNQSLESVLALISIFGKAGVPAAQAATMINQAFTRLGNPETMQFIEAILEYGSALPEVLERVGGQMPVLFDVEKGLGDVGEALIATAQTIAVMREQAQKEGWLGEFDRELMQLLYRVFGIRNIRAFLTLSRVSLEEYRALRDTIAQASGAVEEYTQTVYASWETTRQWASNAFANIKRLFGAEMIQFFNPILRFIGEFLNGLFLAGKQVPMVTALLGGLTAFVGTFIAGTAAVSSFVIVLALLNGKLRDLGQRILEVEGMAGMVPAAVAKAGPAAVGRWFVFGRYLPILRQFASLALVVSFAFSAWRVSATGATQALGKLAETLGALSQKTGLGGKATGIGAWFQAALTKPQTAAQAFIGGMIKMVIYSLEWLGKAIKLGMDAIISTFKFTAKAVSAIVHYVFWIPAAILGLGNVEKGYERLRKVVGALGQVFAFFLSAALVKWAVVRGVEGLLLLFKAIKKALFGFTIFGKEISLWKIALGAVNIVVRAIRVIFRNFVNAFNLWRTLSSVMGSIKALWTILSAFFSTFRNWMIKQFIEPLREKLRMLFIQYAIPLIAAIGNLIKVGWKYLSQLILEHILKRKNAQQGIISSITSFIGNIFGGLGGIAGGIGGIAGGLGGLGMLGGLGGALAAALPGLWWILPLLAILGGVGYGIYRLVTRPSAAPATTYQPVPPAAAGPAYATMSVNIAPTIIVPQGTTAEQAQAIMAELEPQIVALFKRLNWHEELNTMEKNMRAGLTAGVV